MRLFVPLVALTCFTLGLSDSPAADPAPQIVFGIKDFVDTGHLVHIEGTLTGDGIGYENNRSAVTCYQDQRECLSVHIEAQGLQVFSIGLPTTFNVQVWTADRIVADLAVPCGDPSNDRVKKEWQATQSDTWIIDRERQSAELIEHPCFGARTYHWTIEDPVFWKKAMEGLKDPKPPR